MTRANVGYRTEISVHPRENGDTPIEAYAMLLQELPTKMVRHVVRSVTWSDLDLGGRAARTPADWLQFYYLAWGAGIVLLRKIWLFIANRAG